MWKEEGDFNERKRTEERSVWKEESQERLCSVQKKEDKSHDNKGVTEQLRVSRSRNESDWNEEPFGQDSVDYTSLDYSVREERYLRKETL